MNIKAQIEVFRPFDGVRPNSEVLLSFVELEEGDALIQREFELAPKNIYFPGSNELGYLNEDFIFLERGFRSLSAVHMAVGARFRSSTAGPQVGSVVSLWKGRDEVGRLVLVDRDRNVGTFWVYEANRELREDDRFY